ncbi:hypothetical protein QN362_13680 [Actimicrobium sp. CCC2.4]|uniref:hypothetical protein n=1 Tax=Actimicrobium sp. CCC2.4 TaxID=3048606 RepID=UPI002AC98729|nr:hypothetical protein [Actimicrobium sp. CCC2.4]MEB0136388.1 hypothetical protein [Actimicrobium sp. CCC2.4]WPX31207.1 hypothetical protein RHM62_13235 [Actimicrobium sp. CCC2.4]
MMFRKKRVSFPSEIALAIGLIWGHLNARQMEDAYQLACGCAALWPDDSRFALMASYAAVELAAPLEDFMLDALKNTGSTPWTKLIWRRAFCPGNPAAGVDHE